MKYLLDTDCCVYLLTNQKPALLQRVGMCEAGSLAISAITFAEIAHGTANGKLPSRDVLDAFIGEIPVLPFDEAIARHYATLPFRRGRFDRLIAAHALALGLIIVTNNEGDFIDVAGLTVENWTIASVGEP